MSAQIMVHSVAEFRLDYAMMLQATIPGKAFRTVVNGTAYYEHQRVLNYGLFSSQFQPVYAVMLQATNLGKKL
jgi:hypothetical protein